MQSENSLFFKYIKRLTKKTGSFIFAKKTVEEEFKRQLFKLETKKKVLIKKLNNESIPGKKNSYRLELKIVNKQIDIAEKQIRKHHELADFHISNQV